VLIVKKIVRGASCGCSGEGLPMGGTPDSGCDGTLHATENVQVVFRIHMLKTLSMGYR
jgi:hypothetical protein